MNTDERRALKLLRERYDPLIEELAFRRWCEKRKRGEHDTPLQIVELWLAREVKL